MSASQHVGAEPEVAECARVRFGRRGSAVGSTVSRDRREDPYQTRKEHKRLRQPQRWDGSQKPNIRSGPYRQQQVVQLRLA